MNPDHIALFANVLANPDDDLPRLVFADYLEESGDPANAARAAYIRGQIEAEAHAPGSDDRLKLNRRLADLRDRFRDEWDRAFSRPEDWHGFRVERRRGFVDEVSVGLTRFTQVGRRMFAAAPVRLLRLTDGGEPEEWANFAAADYLATLRELCLERSAAQLGGVFWDGNDERRFVPGVAFRALMASTSLTSLRRLDLSGVGLINEFVPAFVAAIAESELVRRLEELDVSRTALTAVGIADLLAGLPDGCRVVAQRLNISIVDGLELGRRFGDRVRV